MVCFPSLFFFLYVKEQNIILQSLKKVVLHFYTFCTEFLRFFFSPFVAFLFSW